MADKNDDFGLEEGQDGAFAYFDLGTVVKLEKANGGLVVKVKAKHHPQISSIEPAWVVQEKNAQRLAGSIVLDAYTAAQPWCPELDQVDLEAYDFAVEFVQKGNMRSCKFHALPPRRGTLPYGRRLFKITVDDRHPPLVQWAYARDSA